MKTKLKLKFITRLKLAAAAFRGKPFEMEVEPLHCKAQLTGHVKCDNNYHSTGQHPGCDNLETVCLSRTMAELTIGDGDHTHLCQRCADELLAKK